MQYGIWPKLEYNIFISHSWTYSNAYDVLISNLRSDLFFKFKDYSVPKNNPIHNANNQKELREAIKNQMSYASVVLIMAGKYATYSKWINIEIELAQKGFLNRKPIIAIKPRAALQVSAPVALAADIIVGWNAPTIIKAIKDLG